MIRETPGLAARGGHDVDLGGALGAAGESDQRPIGRKPGVAGIRDVRGQALGAPASGGDAPEVVLRREDDLVVVDGGEADIAKVLLGAGHLCPFVSHLSLLSSDQEVLTPSPQWGTPAPSGGPQPQAPSGDPNPSPLRWGGEPEVRRA